MNTIKLSDFDFTFNGYGHYKVTYTSPLTGKKWDKIISNMGIIDKTKNCDYPLIKDLKLLKSIVKQSKT
jgi:hypothetical protein